MARTSIAALRRIRNGHPLKIVPRVFVETGTLHAETARFARQLYNVVETIELSEALYTAAVARYGGDGIRFHHGDSVEFLPTILKGFAEPVCIYLDAHWFPRDGVVGQGQFPLWQELATIAARPYPDIVVVDDVHSFGQAHPTTDWCDVMPERITEVLGRVLMSMTYDDHLVLYRGPACE